MKALEIEKPLSSEHTLKLRVLVLEQSSNDSEALLRELRKAGMDIDPVVVAGRADFEAAITSGGFAAVLTGDQAAGWTALEALQCFRQAGHETPFLLVINSSLEEEDAESLKLGFDDYVLRERLTRIPAALKRVIQEKQLRDEKDRISSALQDSETRNRELIENSQYGIFRVALDGSFLSANPALLQILACGSPGELQRLNLATDVFRYREEFVKLIAACRAHGLVQSAESEWHRKDGGLVSVRLRMRHLSLPGSEEVLEGMVEDVTELRALEHQLRQAQKFETIGQLAGGIVHDFNNVVGAILGWAEIGFEQSRSYPSIAERFGRIREQADRAASLTREFLSFARRQANQLRPVDLNAVIKGLTSFLDKVIGKDIEIKYVEGVLRPVHADIAQIEQVLMNLCLNARDAMPDGGNLSIETEMVQLDDTYCRLYSGVSPGCYAVISVTDTGAGMSAETRERIFEPFFTTKECGKGTGIGLAPVYGIVKQHGGFIQVYSEPGNGSRFHVHLPVMDEALDAGAPHVTEAPASADLHGKETILYAEDHESIREMVRQSLVNLGYRVMAASDGEQALRFCEYETPALAILDVVMPHMGGQATAARLVARFPKLPILYTSGYLQASPNSPPQVPNTRFLQKPYSPVSRPRHPRSPRYPPFALVLNPALLPGMATLCRSAGFSLT